MKRTRSIASAMLLACILVLTMALSVPAWAGEESEEAAFLSECETVPEDVSPSENEDRSEDPQPEDEDPVCLTDVREDPADNKEDESFLFWDEDNTEDLFENESDSFDLSKENPDGSEGIEAELPEEEADGTEPNESEEIPESGEELPMESSSPEEADPSLSASVESEKSPEQAAFPDPAGSSEQSPVSSEAAETEASASTVSAKPAAAAKTASVSYPLKSITIKYRSLAYTGEKRTQSATTVVTANVNGTEKKLKQGTEYTLSYSNNLNAGTATITASGVGKYTGTLRIKFKIAPAKLLSAKLKYSSLLYNGKARTQSGTTIVRGKEKGKLKDLTRGTDYKISYKNNTKVGKAIVTITGIKNYTGKLIRTFKILPKKTVLTDVVSGTASCVVRWKKQNVQTTGYQLQISTNKSFKSDVRTITVKKPSILQKKIASLKTGRVYYVRIRTYRTKGNNNYYSEWSPAKSVAIKANTVRITGSGISRTVTVDNPSSSYKTMKVGVWSKAGDQDDLTWYTLKKQSDGSFKTRISVLNLQHCGACFADVYANDIKCISNQTFSVTKSEYALTENTLKISGSGTSRTVLLIHPAASVIDPEIAVWSAEDGKDDLKWYKMTKLENGNWSANVSTIPLLHSGKVNVRCYSDNQSVLIRSGTFSSSLTTGEITWDPDWEFASYSEIHTGTPKIYRAGSNRKNIVVGINPGHGTVDGSYYYVLSHPDGSPKITGGSTAEGAVYTPADNEGITFYDGVPEASVTLRQAEILRDILLDAGYDVIMLREDNDSGLDVVGRTVVCNELADCHIALHWDGDGLSYEKGIFYMSVPDGLKDMYPTSTIWSESDHLGECLISGLSSQGLLIFEGGSMPIDLMQTSYSKIPSIDIELGNQASSHTDSDLTVRAYGILDGLNKYFGE